VNQVAGDEQLLDIAKDYFQFVANFFEAIKISATHIYHSALELCPVSSIVRKLYHHRRIARSPEVVIGTPNSWEPTIATSGNYRFYTWSLCGQFVAAQMGNVVEIRNQLTLEPIAILWPTEAIPDLTGRLAYSPDGRFIACASKTGVIIWDIQTGGVAKEIQHRAEKISLVWSSDGGTLCTIESDIHFNRIVHIHDISSGTTSSTSPGTLQSKKWPYLWVDDKSFWIITMRDSGDGVDIFKVGSTLTKIRSFDFSPSSDAEIGSFSPTTQRVSIFGDSIICIFDIQNSKLLLDETDYDSYSHCFSSDGSLFAASQEDSVHIWKYASGCYTRWREFRCQDFDDPLFSPTSSSILGRSDGFLQVLRLHELPTTPEIHHQQFAGLSRSGTHVATAHELGNTVTITDLLARTPPQFIDTNVEIRRLFLTGNVLLVAGSEEIIAWLLTEEGLVDGVIGGRRVGRSDSIWTTSKLDNYPPLLGGQVGVIDLCTGAPHVYHTETGEILDPTQAPYYSERRYYNNIPQRDTPPEDAWQTSRDTLREGWVKDPEGKHRMWVPVEWRERWDPEDWHHDTTTQFSYILGRPILIRF